MSLKAPYTSEMALPPVVAAAAESAVPVRAAMPRGGSRKEPCPERGTFWKAVL